MEIFKDISRRARAAGVLITLMTPVFSAYAGVSVRTSAFEYDDRGNLIKEVIEPNDSDLCLVSEFQVNHFGRRTGSTVRNCNGSPLPDGVEASAPAGSAVIASRSTSTGYDTSGRYVSVVTNPVGHSSQTSFEPRYGNLVSATDENNLTVTASYDDWGRKTHTVDAVSNQESISYHYCAGYNAGYAICPSNARYLVEVQKLSPLGTTNGPWTKTYFDELDRAVLKETVGFDGVTIIKQLTDYDALGQLQRTSKPHRAGDAVHWAEYSYDQYGRVTRVQSPNGAVTETTFKGQITEVTNAKGQMEARVINSQGWLVKSVDAQGNELHMQYDPLGNLIRTEDPDGNVTTMSYDLRGRKTAINDPNMGTWSYVYNSLGELIEQTDAKSQVTALEYDLLGRMVRRTEPDLVSEWRYDRNLQGLPCGKSAGKLCVAQSNNGYKRELTYDSKGRPSQTEVEIDEVYTTSVTYDTAGRGVATLTYPGGFAIKHAYTTHGRLLDVRNAANDKLYWQANDVDAEGHILEEEYGSGTTVQYNYNNATGRVMDIMAGANNRIQDLSYEYDLLGNVTSRSDSNESLTETFQYDNLNRLTQTLVNSTAAGSVMRAYNYGVNGNITSRGGVGAYHYGDAGNPSVRPHAVRRIDQSNGALEYVYDANGNMTNKIVKNGSGSVVAYKSVAVTYSSYNMPTAFHRPGALLVPQVSLSFEYGPDRQRFRQQANNDITTYVHPDNLGGLLYEKRKVSGFTHHRYYISAGGMPVAQVIRNNLGMTVSTEYLFRDALGSTVTITNGLSLVSERLGYEAFGKRRRANGREADGLEGNNTDRGFTNHEHLDELGLIHMNGRVYDPEIGRFLTPDFIVQQPDNIQSHNRYSYAVNNPLIYTDPSGHIFGIGRALKNLERSVRHEVKRWESDFRNELRRSNSLLAPILRVAGQALAVLCGPGQPGCAAASEAAIGRAQGIKGSELVRSSLRAGATAFAFQQASTIGLNEAKTAYVDSLGLTAARYATYAAVGCASSASGGGNCGGGAAAAFVSHYSSVNHDSLLTASIVGGVASELTGGKFGDGMVIGAFAYAVGDMSRRRTAKTADESSSAESAEQQKDTGGWVRPDDHPYVVGREGNKLVYPGPARGIGQFLDDYWPAMHTFGTNHDAFVGWVNPNGYMIVDLIVNVPSMFIMYPMAIAQELLNSPVYIVNMFVETPHRGPLAHSHGEAP